MSNLVSAQSLSVNQNLSVNGTITSSSDISTVGNISCNNVNSTGNLTSNNLIINGTLNNAINNQNLLSLDTTSSIQTSLNTINTRLTTNETNITTINGILPTKADDNKVVHNTGNENISGIKTFQNNLIVSSITLNNLDLATRLTTNETNITTINGILLTKADDNKVVHNTGNETIAGIKTFSNNIIVPNVQATDYFFTSYIDPILGNTSSSLSQRWTALYQSLQNNINLTSTNTNNISTLQTKVTTLESQVSSLQTQVTSLQNRSVKAYGRWNGTSVVIGGEYVNQSQCLFGNFTLNGVGYYGTKIQLSSSVTGLKGIINVTCDQVEGYFARFEFLSNPFEFAVITYNPNGTVGNYSFFFTVI